MSYINKSVDYVNEVLHDDFAIVKIFLYVINIIKPNFHSIFHYVINNQESGYFGTGLQIYRIIQLNTKQHRLINKRI